MQMNVNVSNAPQSCAQPGASACAKIPKASGLRSTELCQPCHPRTFCNQAAKSLPEQAAPQIIRMMPTGVVGLKMVIPGNPMVYLYPQFSLSKWPVYLVFKMFKHIQMELCTARRIAARAPSQTDFLQGSAREALEEASMQGGCARLNLWKNQ